ncbi:putative WEB family protein At1g65010, chloroplastic [Aristolochia californica]|uniref:putative WEB family protein At1g65010, chloroplastic n=1 Tax=Aristolochia californica TaxID=171875 RepID=UPI0035D942FE
MDEAMLNMELFRKIKKDDVSFGSSEAPRRLSSHLSSSKITIAKSSKINPALSDEDSNPGGQLLERNLSAKITAMAERRTQRGLELQQQLAQIQDELRKTRNKLTDVEKEKSHVLDELEVIKKVGEETNMKLSEALLGQRVAEGKLEMERVHCSQLEQAIIESAQKRDQAWQLELEANQKQHAVDVEALLAVTKELNVVKQELSFAIKARNEAFRVAEEARALAYRKNSTDSSGGSDIGSEMNDVSDEESKTGESNELDSYTCSLMESLKLEKENAKDLEAKLAEKESMMEGLAMEVEEARKSESRMSTLLSESRVRARKLEQELEKAKESETKTYDSLHSLTKQLEQTKISLEEAKLIMVNQDSKHGRMANLTAQFHDTDSTKGTGRKLQFADGCEDYSVLDSSKLAEEMTLLRNELQLAIGGEERSAKAMDGFALALKEVTTEANQLKGKLASAEAELTTSRTEVEYTGIMLKNTEQRYLNLLNESRKEIAKFKDDNERLKLEAEESFAAWNGKENCFVQCIKKYEEQIAREKEENLRLLEALTEVDEAAKVSKQENNRLRDILKQAVNEATVAKEASEIARAENSQLKDSLSDMAISLERLKINEASALESVQELKNMLPKNGDSNQESESKELKNTNGNVKESKKPSKVPSELPKSPQLSALSIEAPPRTLLELPKLALPSVTIEAPKLPFGQKNAVEDLDILEGSIFTVDSPNENKRLDTANRHFHRKAHSLVLMDDLEHMTSGDSDMPKSYLDDMDNERSSAAQRKKKALLARFGSLIRKRSFR